MIGEIVALALYGLGMLQMSDWFPHLDRLFAAQGRVFTRTAKAKMLLSWPYLVILDVIKDYKEDHKND